VIGCPVGIITMLWFSVSALALLVGAELNGVLEQNGAPSR
jgi:uncharacterized BrkB/YihY/UPF0761 family membrane protein